MLKPIEMVTVKDQIKNILRDAILSNEFKRGDALNVGELAEKLGVSTMPVREALSVLERDGLVELRPRKTAIVLGADEKYVREYYQIRALLEGEAAVLASNRADEEIPDLRKALEECADMCDTEDFALYSQQNVVFHQTIWEMSGNRRLQVMLRDLWMSKSITQTRYTVADMEDTARCHREIARYILEHRAEDARKAMESHLLEGMKVVLRQFTQN